MTDVLFVTQALVGGGAERSVTLLGNELCSMGVSVGLIALRTSVMGTGDDSIAADARFPAKSLGRSGPGMRSFVSTVPRFRSAVAEMHPRVLHAHCEPAELMLAMAGSGSLRPFVTEHQRVPWPSPLRRPLGWAVRSKLRRQGTRWIAPSRDMDVWRVGAPDFVIRNALPDPAEHHLGTRVAAGDAPPRLVVVGRHEAIKRIDWVICAVGLLPRERPPLLLVGAGSRSAELERLARSLEVEATFVGHDTNPWTLVRPQDVVVSASASESDGLSLAEAVSLQLRVLASNISGHRNLGIPPSAMFTSVEQLTRLVQAALKADPSHESTKREQLAHEIIQARSRRRVASEHLAAFGL